MEERDESERMSIDKALLILADMHTRDDDFSGFSVSLAPTLSGGRATVGEYIKAWKTVREHLHMQVKPAEE